MRKIPTVFVRNPEDRRYVTAEVNPECQWVLDGEGIATRKYDGTCFLRDEQGWWARREVKPGKPTPPNYRAVETDENTGKTVGWEPAEQSSFVKFWREATYGKHAHEHGTYELCGPKINGNPEGYETHVLVRHDDAARVALPEGFPVAYDALRPVLLAMGEAGIEGIVWHHPDGRMAKLKGRDFPTTPAETDRSAP